MTNPDGKPDTGSEIRIARERALEVIARELVAWFSTEAPRMSQLESDALASQIAEALSRP